MTAGVPETSTADDRLRVAREAVQEWTRCIAVGQRGTRRATLRDVVTFTLIRQILPGAIAMLLGAATREHMKDRYGTSKGLQSQIPNIAAAAVTLFLCALLGVLWPGALFGKGLHGPIWWTLRSGLLPGPVRRLLGLYPPASHAAPNSLWVSDDRSEMMSPDGRTVLRASVPLQSSVLGGGYPGPTAECMPGQGPTVLDGASGRRTVPEIWQGSVASSGDRRCQGYRHIIEEIPQEEGAMPSGGVTRPGRTVNKLVLSPEYSWWSYSEVDERVSLLGAGLALLMQDGPVNGGGLGTHVGIYADTKAEWMQSLLACANAPYLLLGSLPLTVVTAYATLGLDALGYALELTGVGLVITDETLLGSLAEVAIGRMVPVEGRSVSRRTDGSTIRVAVYIPRTTRTSAPDPAAVKALESRPVAQGGPVTVLSIEQVMEKGRLHILSKSMRPSTLAHRSSLSTVPLRAPTPDDTAMIMFTSGTTGLPKGVEISHGNLAAAAAGIGGIVPSLGPDDCMVAYLPLAHVLEVAAEMALISVGASLGYSSPRTLTDTGPLLPDARKPRLDGKTSPVPVVRGDSLVLQPTIMAGVPAVFDKIGKAVSARLRTSSWIARTMFALAYRAKSSALAVGADPHPFWDYLLFDLIRSRALSGRIRGILSGGGPLSAEIQELVSTVFAPCLQGYGLTETTGAGTVTWANDPVYGRVGAPVLCTQVRLVDWAEGGYVHDPKDGSNPRGEVYIAGPAVTKGYHKNPSKTTESYVLDTTGKKWFATGDIAEVFPTGTLAIIDRKKDLVKLSHGEYVALGRVEAVLGQSSLVEGVMVYGEGTHAYTVAIVVPNPDGLRSRLPSLTDCSRSALVENEAVTAAILADFNRLAKEHRLQKADVPASIAVVGDEWTPGTPLAAELLTESMKLKRPVAVARYKQQLNALYRDQVHH